MLRWRLISAAIIITLLLTLHGLDLRLVGFYTPGAWLLPLLVVVSLLATAELLDLLRAKGHRPVAWIVYAGNVLVPLATGWPIIAGVIGIRWAAADRLGPTGLAIAALALLTALVLVGEMRRFERPGRAFVEAALSVFIVCYIGLLISFWPLLRLVGGNGAGMAALFSMLLITKMADTGAFAVGKRFGRHKLTPVLSPGKTWEGAIGGLATAGLTAWLFFQYATPAILRYGEPTSAAAASYVPPPLIASLAYGMLLAVAGMIGDLGESLLKRDMERKDSSVWLPGLGGVLDIIDAPLVAGPVAWLCWTCGLVSS